jgi:ubiquinone/menaquinone biosynthesis C-methylase UbiE
MAVNGESVSEDWYARAFGPLYPIIYAHRTVEAARREAHAAAQWLELQPGDRVLDLGCGTGRHLVHLGGRAGSLIGLDYSMDLLHHARERFAHEGQECKTTPCFVRGDMRAIPFVEAFDALLNFFTSFGYFQEREENLSVVKGMARALRPGGRFFIDYVNGEHVAASLERKTVREQDGYVIEERRWIEDERVNKRTRVEKGGVEIERLEESVALFNEREFRELLAQGGLAVEHAFGDYDGASVDPERPRLIAIGRKAPE